MQHPTTKKNQALPCSAATKRKYPAPQLAPKKRDRHFHQAPNKKQATPPPSNQPRCERDCAEDARNDRDHAEGARNDRDRAKVKMQKRDRTEKGVMRNCAEEGEGWCRGTRNAGRAQNMVLSGKGMAPSERGIV